MPLITTTFVFNFAWNLSLLDEENTGKHFIGFYSVKRVQKYRYDNMLSRGKIIQQTDTKYRQRKIMRNRVGGIQHLCYTYYALHLGY